jgi:hypothetical protein
MLAHLRACPFRLDVGAFKAWRQGRRSKPELASNLPIPDSLANRG